MNPQPNQQPAHSPELILLPQDGETSISGFTVVLEKGRLISRGYFAYRQDAELFVKACNSHQALVDALQNMLRHFEDCEQDYAFIQQAREALRSATQ